MKITGRVYLVGSCALLVSSLVSAYVLFSPEMTWESPPTYTVDDRGQSSITDSDGGITATVDAIMSGSAWNGAGAGPVVNAQAGPVSGWELGDGIPMLNFRDPTGQCTDSCLAATFILSGQVGQGQNQKTRFIDADIVTNTAHNFTSTSEDPQGAGCSGEFYIEGVHVHEIGHGLGLDHTDVGGATMYPSVAACNNGPATIEEDDIAGLCALYGCDGGGNPSCELGQFGDSCGDNNECCSGKCRGKPGRQFCRGRSL